MHMNVKRVIIGENNLRIDFAETWAESLIVTDKTEREQILEGLKTKSLQEYFRPCKLQPVHYKKGVYYKIVRDVV